MKITRKDICEPTTFEALTAGSVFEYEDEVYMKAYRIDLQERVAVDLVGGNIFAIDADAEVIPLDAELIIRGEQHEDTSR